MLKTIKSLNNNIVLAVKNNTGEEFILFGTGIGFKKKKGDMIDENLAQKIFRPADSVKAEERIKGISPEILLVTEKIVTLAENKLNKELNQSLLFSLSDHLDFAVKNNDQINSDNPLQWEVPHLYYVEHEIGRNALLIIERELGIKLPEAEASFIALHLVNAQLDHMTIEDTVQVTNLIKQIISIIQRLFEINLDKQMVTYSRFITHLRYFIARNNNEKNKIPPGTMDDDFRQLIQEQYMRSYACALMIKDMIEKEYGWKVSDDEVVYLVIHIERLVKENQN
ncbi:PRD domain-containing protein [Salipaludibacillus sp. CUR1]|uniref:PRD domain-containing protein n=1 Tax=Salipaludibacillus sp. CUR1 TaxID=2820003 RepID=UPI001E4D25EF|nr:PRD domain-containing protein [Salipaludibacillus sp. CUR1]MCE7792315.1 PRD domain-containing protein [Salipaludibacillus sp. CUR1]